MSERLCITCETGLACVVCGSCRECNVRHGVNCLDGNGDHEYEAPDDGVEVDERIADAMDAARDEDIADLFADERTVYGPDGRG